MVKLDYGKNLGYNQRKRFGGQLYRNYPVCPNAL